MSLTILQAVTAINDATMLITVLSPLVAQAQQSGKAEITDAEVTAARERLVSTLTRLDQAIEKADPQTPAR